MAVPVLPAEAICAAKWGDGNKKMSFVGSKKTCRPIIPVREKAGKTHS